jgi:hypothetical protein
VLEGATDQIIGDADVKRAAPTIGEDVDPETHFGPRRQRAFYRSPAGLTRGSIIFRKKLFAKGWMAGSSPAMTGIERSSPKPARHPRA